MSAEKTITLAHPKDGVVMLGPDEISPLFEPGDVLQGAYEDGEIVEYEVVSFDWRKGVITVRERGGAR